jgi:uncharacterized protein (TIGR03085 family)
MTELRPARAERHALADLLSDLGPDAPTLCTGWTTRDLAAHLIIRERRLDAAPGIVVRPLRPHMERVRRATAARPFPELVEKVRRAAWWTGAPPLDNAVNTAEFFIHHEDVRRAQPDWRPRELPPSHVAALWRQIRAVARLGLRRFPATVLLVSPGYGEVRAGAGGSTVTVTAPPGELAIFCTGRQHAALTEVTGPPELADRLRTARLGI